MKALICGGAGFVGQAVAKRLESDGHAYRIFDRALPMIGAGVCGNIHDLELLTQYMAGSDIVFHLASNADISASASNPAIDFHEGTELTQNVLEAMRISGVRRLIYFSGSGVYGDKPGVTFTEDSCLEPISTYGASKMASEGMIQAYCAMFGIQAKVFRPANIVGPGQTHGVGFDFMRKLKAEGRSLRVLGDGQQTKSYIHIEDALDAVWMVMQNWESCGRTFNLASDDYITVSDIAEIAIGLRALTDCRVEYAGGDRGWNGDVPRVNFDCSKLKRLGWLPKKGSKEAITDAMVSML